MADTDYLDRDLIVGKVVNGYTIVGHRYEKEPKHQTVLTLQGERTLEYRFSYVTSNDYILEVLGKTPVVEPKERVFVLGNGPSLLDVDFEKLKGETTYAVNRIWKLFDKVDWRPTHYVRGEIAFNRSEIFEDVQEMAKYPGIRWYMMAGLQRMKCNLHPPDTDYFAGCEGSPHAWHLPMICAYGTVVHIAMQIAVRDGAKSIYLLGCDLGNDHFYDNGYKNDLALEAHKIARDSCPVPIYNAGRGGHLHVYPRRRRW